MKGLNLAIAAVVLTSILLTGQPALARGFGGHMGNFGGHEGSFGHRNDGFAREGFGHSGEAGGMFSRFGGSGMGNGGGFSEMRGTGGLSGSQPLSSLFTARAPDCAHHGTSNG